MNRNSGILTLFFIFCSCGAFSCKDSAKVPGEMRAHEKAMEKSIPAKKVKEIAEEDIFTVTSAPRWFTDDAHSLKQQVDGFLAKAEKKELPGRVKALISPHAGFMCSGRVAAWSYCQVAGHEYDTVIVVGFNHRPRAQGIAVYAKGGFRTPLGVIPIDTDTADELIRSHERIQHNPSAFAGEHSLDNQLPFLQRALGSFFLVPVLLCSQDDHNIDALAEALISAAKNKRALLVASTDLSHFWPHEQAAKLDREALEKVLELDAGGLADLLGNDPTGRRMCGRGAVQAVIRAATGLGADTAHLLQYADSFDTTGTSEGRVVGYCAVALTGPDNGTTSGKGEEMKKFDNDKELDSGDCRRLLEIARKSLDLFVREGKKIDVPDDRPRLNAKRGVFVTLNKNGRLRGCMGHFEDDTRLCEIVARQVTVSAAQDPRFRPVEADELDDITIEISVLSVPEETDSFEEIEVGLHGVILRKKGRGATFLPQVAPEQGWDRDEMLTHLSMKAGLPGDAWKSGATFLLYTAQVFGE